MPDSAARARRWVRRRLGAVESQLSATVELLVSELVTNAILHAGTAIVLELHRLPDRIRIDVADGNPALPSVRRFGVEASTGRGLSLVQALAGDWGVQPIPGGKVVWFELPVDLPDPVDHVPRQPRLDLDSWPELPPKAPPSSVPASVSEEAEIDLLGVPLQQLRTAAQEYQALFRELRMVAGHHPDALDGMPRRAVAAIDELTRLLAGSLKGAADLLALADQQGKTTVDLQLRVPPAVAETCRRHDELMDEADRACRAGELLTLPVSPRTRDTRRWVLAQFVNQTGGRPAVAWPDWAVFDRGGTDLG